MAFATDRGRRLTTAQADWREGALDITIAVGVALVAMTEGLSAFGLITRLPIVIFWVALSATALSSIRHYRPLGFSCISRGERWLLAGLATLTVLLGVVALFAPPNTSDSLAYHMSRVANWQQQQSVRHYPAGFLPQLFHPPLAEFAILNLQVIAGSDRFANLPQWLAMVGSLVVVSLIAGMLGANRKGQVLAAVFAGTLPVGILEATGTQNDYVAAFWSACFVACVLRISMASDRARWPMYFAAGAALGLALLAKATNYVYVVPFGVLLVMTCLRQFTWTRVVMLASVAVIALAINSGYYARNYSLFSAPLGPGLDEGNNTTYVVDRVTVGGFLSNVLRNLSLHFGTPDVDLNHTIYDDVVGVHSWLGVSPNSPDTTFSGVYPQSAVNLEMHDSRAGNLVALILLVLTIFAGAVGGTFRGNRAFLVYLVAWIASFLVFCLVLKWQLWNARLHLAWFVLGAPLIGMVWTKPLSRTVWRVLIAAVCVAVLLRAQGDLQSSPRRVLVLLVLVLVATPIATVVERRRGWLTRMSRAFVSGYLTSERRFGEVAWMPVGCILLVSSLPWLAFNEIRPLLGPASVLTVSRDDQYFVNGPDEEAPYVWATNEIVADGCNRVGLLVGPGVWDYPMWALLHERLPDVAIRNVYVPNVSARLSGPTFTPCAVVGLRPVDGDEVRVDETSFTRVVRPKALDGSDSSIAVFLPSE